MADANSRCSHHGMRRDGTYTGEADRIEPGETAVILIEVGGAVIERFDLPTDGLPHEGNEGGVPAVLSGIGSSTGRTWRVAPRDRPEAMGERSAAIDAVVRP